MQSILGCAEEVVKSTVGKHSSLCIHIDGHLISICVQAIVQLYTHVLQYLQCYFKVLPSLQSGDYHHLSRVIVTAVDGVHTLVGWSELHGGRKGGRGRGERDGGRERVKEGGREGGRDRTHY